MLQEFRYDSNNLPLKMDDKKAKTKVAKLLGITIILFLISNALLFITVYLPRIILAKEEISIYLSIIFLLALINMVLIVLGINLVRKGGDMARQLRIKRKE